MQRRGEYIALCFDHDLSGDEIAAARAYARGRRGPVACAREYRATNLIPTTGHNVLMRLLAGDTAYSGEINYGALGTGAAAFTLASTHLTTETFRTTKNDAEAGDNIAYVDWYVAAGDVADGTYDEFGAFIDGTGSADSGQAFSLLLTGGWVKSGSMFISLKVTSENA